MNILIENYFISIIFLNFNKGATIGRNIEMVAELSSRTMEQIIGYLREKDTIRLT